MPEKIVLIGAGSSNFGLGIVGDIFKSKVLEGSQIILHDTNPTALQRVYEITARHIQEHALPFTVSATIERKEALQGATFCVISIEVGDRFELWDQDLQIPQQFGIQQIFGENGGPGGLFHALRIIPPILEICDDIMQICPDATVFNFSNPMSRICTTLTRKYPDLKLVGLCHGVVSLSEHLPHILETPLENIVYRAGGLNHFSVLLEVSYKDSGKDAYPDLRAKAPGYFERLPGSLDQAETSSSAEDRAPYAGFTWSRGKPWPERSLFKIILEEFGYLPIVSDSHFGEYIQWAQEVVDHPAIIDFRRFYRMWCALSANSDRITGSDQDWAIIALIEGLLTGRAYEEPAVNIPNAGFIPNLPRDIVVEVPAIVDGRGIHGVSLGTLPKGIAGLLNNQYAVHDLTAEAVLTRSRQAALQALLLDPLVHSYRAARQTLDTILAVQQRYLGYLQ